MRIRSARKNLRLRKRTPFAETRPFIHGKDSLAGLTFDEDGISLQGDSRCHALGLEMGDCRGSRVVDSFYCYYHDKLQRGLLTASVPAPEEADQRDGMALYPIWPLPVEGYYMLSPAPRRPQ